MAKWPNGCSASLTESARSKQMNYNVNVNVHVHIHIHVGVHATSTASPPALRLAFRTYLAFAVLLISISDCLTLNGLNWCRRRRRTGHNAENASFTKRPFGCGTTRSDELNEWRILGSVRTAIALVGSIAPRTLAAQQHVAFGVLPQSASWPLTPACETRRLRSAVTHCPHANKPSAFCLGQRRALCPTHTYPQAYQIFENGLWNSAFFFLVFVCVVCCGRSFRLMAARGIQSQVQ